MQQTPMLEVEAVRDFWVCHGFKKEVARCAQADACDLWLRTKLRLMVLVVAHVVAAVAVRIDKYRIELGSERLIDPAAEIIEFGQPALSRQSAPRIRVG